MNFPEHSPVDDAFRREELARITTFETNACPDAGCFHCLLNVEAIAPGQRERFFNDEMLPGSSSRNCLAGVILRVAANRNGVQVWIVQEIIQIRVGCNFPAMLRAHLRGA